MEYFGFKFEKEELDGIEQSHLNGAFLVYCIYKSRGESFKISNDMWDRITRFVKSSANKAKNIKQFIDILLKKMNAYTLKTGYSEVIKKLLLLLPEKEILRILYTETAFIIAIVRDRLDKEKEKKNV